MGITLKEYVRGMLIKYKEYPEMKNILKELYEEWYEKPQQQGLNSSQGNYCLLNSNCNS